VSFAGYDTAHHSRIEWHGAPALGAVLGRASRPDDLVGVARDLASSVSAFMTGQSLLVDGGMVFV